MVEWKDITDYKGLYRVSTKGEIYSIRYNKNLKQFYRGSRPDNKYLVVDLHKDGMGKTVSVHRMVAEAFIPNPDNLPCVNHKDGNKDNNCVDNLEWCTYSYNNYHACRTGLKNIPSGTKNKNSKLTYDEVVNIKKCLILGDSKCGTRPIARKYGMDHNVILDIYHDRKYQDVKIPYTFFVSSDIHSAYTPWIKALKQAGFNENKYSHKLIVCGDLFDRHDESEEVLNFITDMISKDKIILIKGNHDLLLRDLCERGFPYKHDYHNGTAKTVCDLGNAWTGNDFEECCKLTQNKLKEYNGLLVNYFETKSYIFVHSWIPLINKDGLPAHYTRDSKFEFNPDWRKVSQEDWDDAMWGNPFDLAEKGLNQTGKTIIFGHWHASTGWAKAEGRTEFGVSAKFDPYYGDGFVSIDACTAYSGKVNVLVLEDEFLED